jgi:hypothetical protein
MSNTDLTNSSLERREKRRESWPNKAKRLGVSVRTLDRWVIQGIIAAPEVINGRKYGDADEEPRAA